MAVENYVAGDTFTATATITNESTGAAVDVSGAAITWILAVSPAATAILTKTKSAGEITVSGASNNTVTVAIDAGDTTGLLGVYYYELQITDAGGNVFTPAQGRLRIVAEAIT